jgi:hypothetical protein
MYDKNATRRSDDHLIGVRVGDEQPHGAVGNDDERTDDEDDQFGFDAVPVRERHDGWTRDKQAEFIAALAESGCVEHACDFVGMSKATAYRLRRRPDARSFRVAWDAALDYAIRRLSDAVYSRAINGVAVPHYYKGELIGEHRRYDERLAMFLMRYRDPLRYGKFLDGNKYEGTDEIFAIRLASLQLEVEDEDFDEAMTLRRFKIASEPEFGTTNS